MAMLKLHLKRMNETRKRYGNASLLVPALALSRRHGLSSLTGSVKKAVIVCGRAGGIVQYQDKDDGARRTIAPENGYREGADMSLRF
jgi:hypothetical protein